MKLFYFSSRSYIISAITAFYVFIVGINKLTLFYFCEKLYVNTYNLLLPKIFIFILYEFKFILLFIYNITNLNIRQLFLVLSTSPLRKALVYSITILGTLAEKIKIMFQSFLKLKATSDPSNNAIFL